MSLQDLRRFNQRPPTRADLRGVRAFVETSLVPLAIRQRGAAARLRFASKWTGAHASPLGQVRVGDRTVVATEDVDAVLTKLYSQPATTGNRDALYHRVKLEYLGISRRRVWAFLVRQETHQIHRPRRLHPRIVQPLLALKPFQTWAMDLFDLGAYARENDGYRYVALVVDHMTKYVYLRPLLRKTAQQVTEAVEGILVASPRRPVVLLSDNGKEFRNDLMKSLVAKHGIRQHLFIPPYTPTSNSVAERTVRTTKMKLFAALSQARSRRWIDILPHIQVNINSAPHSSTGFAPATLRQAALDGNQVALNEAAQRLRRLAVRRLERAQSKAPSLPALRVGDVCRVAVDTFKSERKRINRKAYLGNWSTALFRVVRISPGTEVSAAHHRIVHYPSGAVVAQRFYRRDLQRVNTAALQRPPASATNQIQHGLLPDRRMARKFRTGARRDEEDDIDVGGDEK